MSGIVEWVATNGGSVSFFSRDLIVGKVHGVEFRYWVREGWCGVFRTGSGWSPAWNCTSLPEFKRRVKEESARVTKPLPEDLSGSGSVTGFATAVNINMSQEAQS